MMKPRFTEGPWEESCELILDSEGNYLAETVEEDSDGLFEEDEDKRITNAELMAAAPEMLDLLRRIKEGALGTENEIQDLLNRFFEEEDEDDEA